MVRELSALFEMLRKRQLEISEGGRSRAVSAVTPSAAVRISQRPSTDSSSTPQPASFYIPNSGKRSMVSSEGQPGDSAPSWPSPLENAQPWSHIVDFYDAFR